MNDVGTTKFEEVNDMTIGGQNFGWPGAEGNSMNPLYTNPIYAYPHGFAGLGEGCAITGGTFFNPVATNYPGTYTGNYFFIDYCGNWIDMLTFSGSTFTRSNFASDIAGFPVGLTVGTDGNFYFISRNNSALYKIVYGPTPVTTRLTPIADAYVRGASTTANTNYGRAATLLTQANANVGLTYETFLKFDITSFSGPVSSAKLRVYGGLSASTIPSLNVEAHHVSNTSWLDTTITWNNKPAADAAVLATATIHGTSKEYYDWDITAHIIALKTAGATAMTIKLNNTTATAIRAIFNSKEASTFRPQLVIVHAGPPTIMNTARSASTIAQDFDIYPNPAGDFFNISLKNIEGDARLAIYDVKGQLVMKRIIENNSLERINTEMLENGVYLVMISNGNGVMTKKVLLNKGSE